MLTTIVGAGNSVDCVQIFPLDVFNGASTTVTNVAASVGTINYFNGGLDQPATGTITPGSNLTFTFPTWLTASGGVASITVVGAGY